jgi:hypothetical protein
LLMRESIQRATPVGTDHEGAVAAVVEPASTPPIAVEAEPWEAREACSVAAEAAQAANDSNTSSGLAPS